MKEFYFHADQKCIVWDRLSFTIEAETEEEALAKVKEVFEQDGINGFDGEWESIADTMETLSPEQNNGWATEEVYSEPYPYKLVVANGKTIEL